MGVGGRRDDHNLDNMPVFRFLTKKGSGTAASDRQSISVGSQLVKPSKSRVHCCSCCVLCMISLMVCWILLALRHGGRRVVV